jgi:hypothetical protein
MNKAEKIAELVTAVIEREGGMDDLVSVQYCTLNDRVEVHACSDYFFENYDKYGIEQHTARYAHKCTHVTPSGAAVFCLTNRFVEAA